MLIIRLSQSSCRVLDVARRTQINLTHCVPCPRSGGWGGLQGLLKHLLARPRNTGKRESKKYTHRRNSEESQARYPAPLGRQPTSTWPRHTDYEPPYPSVPHSQKIAILISPAPILRTEKTSPVEHKKGRKKRNKETAMWNNRAKERRSEDVPLEARNHGTTLHHI